MIVGLGIDVIEVERMQRTIARYDAHFLDHVFSAEEQAAGPSGAGRAAYYAGRWAAKEAVAKALGTGIGRQCAWKDIRVDNGASGQPQVTLRDRAAASADAKGVRSIHLSISHERRLACAVVVLEGTGDM